MKQFSIPLLAGAVLLSAPLASSADRDKGEADPPRHRYAYTEAYWDGPCKVERRFRHDGQYQEVRKCRGAAAAYAPVVHVPQRAAAVHPSSSVEVQGSVQVR